MNKLALVFCVLFCLAHVSAQDKEPQAKTASSTKVDLARLSHQLRPLDREELAVEAKAWLAIFRTNADAISKEHIAAINATGAEKSSNLVTLRSEQAALNQRVRAVLAAWKAKGAKDEDIEAAEMYLAAAAGDDPGMDLQAIWNFAYGWLVSESGGMQLGVNILLFLLTILVFRILSRLARKLTMKVVDQMQNSSDLLRNFCVNFATRFTLFIGVVVALTMLGIDVGPFLAVIGAAGFIIGFALQGTLNNFAAGIMILIYRPFDVGEVVEVAGVTGKVETMSMSATTIKTPQNQSIIIPNGKIWGDIILNVTGSETRRVDLVFGIGYEDDISKAQAILEEIVDAHELVLEEPAPSIRMTELAESSVNFAVRPWSKTSDYWDVYCDLTRAVKDRFDAAGISIPFPQRDIHIHQVAAGS
jgi:small conductance mechanosensitive channel